MLEIRVLGPVAVSANGRPLALGGPTPTTVLALLATHSPAAVSTERLIAAVWDDPPASARKIVEANVARLRRALDPDRELATDRWIGADGAGGYRLQTPDVATDVMEFRDHLDAAHNARSWRKALDVWSGEPLAGCNTTQLVEAERTRLGEEFSRAVVAWARAAISEGAPELAIAELELQVANHPHHEPFRTHLVDALGAAGRQREDDADRPTTTDVRPSDGASIVEIGVLGPLQVAVDAGGPVHLRPAQRRLLAILVMAAAEGIETDALIDRMWRGEPPATARAALQTHLAALRRNVAGETICTESFGYRIEYEAVDVDVVRFEAGVGASRSAMAGGDPEHAAALAADALELVRGTPYHELADDDFAAPEIARLEELRLSTVELVAEAQLALGHEAEVSALLERLVLANPYREHLWESLIVARHRLGRHAEAVRAFRMLEERLAEAGLEMSDRLRDLEGRVLRHERSLSAPRRTAGLPAPRTKFIGRADDLEVVPELLRESRLVTLVGVGGGGKTRLATEIVGGHGTDAVFADLTPVTDGARVHHAVANALDLQASIGGLSGQELSDRVADALERRSTLLVLDNCEHVIEDCAALVDSILTRSGEIRILATSREPLAVSGERVHRLRPLQAGGEQDDLPEAVALFVDRARAVRSDYEPGPEELGTVRQICESLDGLPLAIEMAAARISHLPAAEIAARLGDRLRLLASPHRTIDRHQTVAAALEWSHDLLDERERTLLRRLAVFAGPFSLPFVEEVCTDELIRPEDAVDLLGRLVDKSLVMPVRHAREARYRLLATVQAFAAAKLEEAHEDEEFRERLCAGYLTWLESHDWGASQRDRGLATKTADEADNIRSALEWTAATGDVERLGRLVGRMHLLWSPRLGNGAEGLRWADEALASEDGLSTPRRAPASGWARALASTTLGSAAQEEDAAQAIAHGADLDGFICEAYGIWALAAASRSITDGSYDLRATAERRLAELERVARRQSDDGWLVHARIYRGLVALLLDELGEANAHFRLALERHDLAWISRLALGSASVTARYLVGDHIGALEAADVVDRAPPSGITPSRTLACARSLADAAAGRDELARAGFRAAIALANPDVPLEVNACLAYASAAALEWGRPKDAARLLGSSTTFGMARATDFRFRDAATFAVHRHVTHRLRADLPDQKRRAVAAEGRNLSEQDALQLFETLVC